MIALLYIDMDTSTQIKYQLLGGSDGVRMGQHGLVITFHICYNATLTGCKIREISSSFPIIIVHLETSVYRDRARDTRPYVVCTPFPMCALNVGSHISEILSFCGHLFSQDNAKLCVLIQL